MAVHLQKRNAGPRVLSSVGPVAAPATSDTYRDDQAGAFISSVANGYLQGATYGASAARYVVGGATDAVVLRANATRAERTASAIAFVAGKPIDAFAGVGYWHDDTTGRVWLDAVQAYATLDAALRVARLRGELAVYDSREDVVIAVAS